MVSPESRARLALMAVGLLVVLGPVLILILTLGALVLLGDVALDRVTFVEFIELYLLELVLFVGFAYGIYRLTLWLVKHQVPASLSVLEASEAAESRDDDAEVIEDR